MANGRTEYELRAKSHKPSAIRNNGGGHVDQMLVLFGNYGFPMVVCAYLLVRIEGKLESLTSSIHQLAQAIGEK